MVVRGTLVALLFTQFGHANGLALVYKGHGSCKEGCSKAAAAVARMAGMQVSYVGPEEISESVLKKATLWIQPGGDARELHTAISPHRKQLLRDFVRTGGGYVGFCAGAYFTDRTVDDANTMEGLNFFEGTTVDYPAPVGASLVSVLWGGRWRRLYFEDGPYFAFAPSFRAEVVGTYPNGAPAVAHFNYGLGRVAASGVHPEAPKEWIEDRELDNEGARNTDLAVDMIDWVKENFRYRK